MESTSRDKVIHISQWVSSMLSNGDIKNIVDPRLQGDFDTNSVWKAVEIAMACASLASIKRPPMNNVVTELTECLSSEVDRTRRRGHENESEASIEMVNMDFESEIIPLAR